MKFYVFASGSKGNSTLVTSKEGHKILIDFGITKSCLDSKLSEQGFSYDDIEAFLFTHNHTDHIKGPISIKEFDYSNVYTSEETLPDIKDEHKLDYYSIYNIAGFKITVLPTSHDAPKSMGFIIEADNEKLVYITDTGYLMEDVLELIKNADYYIIESNYNYNMLMSSNRPEFLKSRISSDSGHLSNEFSAMYIVNSLGERTKQIYLAHISEETNTPSVALDAYINALRKAKLNENNYIIKPCSQHDTVIGGNFDED
ncbi:MAG: MBL fold metallo-hydrolase [Bacilli bacterium]|nr:MBL fold metallo-hydrolase [Bacilli bacterium]